jgi:hypothetical protein
MRLEIGACFADYGPPDFYKAASETFRDRTRLLPNGGIDNYTAGQPFPMLEITAEDPMAGAKWAWNVALRYQGAGFWAPFRTIDMVGRNGTGEPFVGEMWKAQLSFRSDLPEDGYTAPDAKGDFWVAGGSLSEPFDARFNAWRQYRDTDTLKKPELSDDLHAYLPNYRRVRRVSATDVEGVYMPSFSVGVVQATTIAGMGGGLGGGAAGGAAAAAAASSITTKRSGFEVLETRPLLYDFRLIGAKEVLTPINAARPGYPEAKDRDFGPWGLVRDRPLGSAPRRRDRRAQQEPRRRQPGGALRALHRCPDGDAALLHVLRFARRAHRRRDVRRPLERGAHRLSPVAGRFEAPDPRGRFRRRSVREHRGGRRLAPRILDHRLDPAGREDAEARALGEQSLEAALAGAPSTSARLQACGPERLSCAGPACAR